MANFCVYSRGWLLKFHYFVCLRTRAKEGKIPRSELLVGKLEFPDSSCSKLLEFIQSKEAKKLQ